MVFNSAAFVVFLVLIYALYWMVSRKSARAQNIVLIIAGCCFYGIWDLRFLGLLIASGTADFFIAQQTEKSAEAKSKRRWMLLSLVINIGALVYFKYLNFFAESFSELLALFGMQAGFITQNLILPLGISYYTFLKFGYILDVWRGNQKAESAPVNFFSFLLFFPYMLAGPVERAGNMLPQLANHRVFSQPETAIALRIILWGYFKKVVIADRLGQIVEPVFGHSDSYSGSALAAAYYCFTFSSMLISPVTLTLPAEFQNCSASTSSTISIVRSILHQSENTGGAGTFLFLPGSITICLHHLLFKPATGVSLDCTSRSSSHFS
jgi:alginate O-acetyltransferase complex protein AlgI